MALRVLTWHVHGSYLDYLAECGHDFVVPVLPGRPPRFAGRPPDAKWPDNVTELPAERIACEPFDCILYQHADNWRIDRFEWLSERQMLLPQAFLEHDPPLGHPTDTRHVVDDPSVPVVHVTHFNDLMWDCGSSPTVVIEHGVRIPDDVTWTGERPRGITAVNNLSRRGRRLGPDVFDRMRGRLPIDLVGLGSEEFGGLGEVRPADLPYEFAKYRFFFNPIRYTSLGLAVCEAMACGLPIIGLATTEMAVAVRDGECGFADTDVERLVDAGELLVEDFNLAARLSRNARDYARERFSIERFARGWRGFLDDLAASGGSRRVTPVLSRLEPSPAHLVAQG